MRTWTGFKWIVRADRDPRASPTPPSGAPSRFVLGYEEALGVCAGEAVRDKDGISAALLIADLAAALAQQGRTLIDAIADLHARHGVHASGQFALTRPGPDGRDEIAAIMASLRRSPPGDLGGIALGEWIDHATPPPGSAAGGANLLETSTVCGDRVLFRPSGTEPKLKAYVEVVEPPGEGGLSGAEAAARTRLAQLTDAIGALFGEITAR